MYFTDEKVAEIQEKYEEIYGWHADGQGLRLSPGWDQGIIKGIMVVCKIEELDDFIKDLQRMQKAIKEVTGLVC